MAEVELLKSELVLTADVMVATVYLEAGTKEEPGGYGGTVNHAGAAGGARHDQGFSIGYRRLKATFESLGRQARALGWRPIEHPAEWMLIRYVLDARTFDAINMGSAEANGFTAGGAWADDGVAWDARKRRLTDREGPDRLVSILVRIPPAEGQRPITARPVKNRKNPDKPQKNPKTPKTRPSRPRHLGELKSGDHLTLDEVAALKRDGIIP